MSSAKNNDKVWNLSEDALAELRRAAILHGLGRLVALCDELSRQGVIMHKALARIISDASHDHRPRRELRSDMPILSAYMAGAFDGRMAAAETAISAMRAIKEGDLTATLARKEGGEQQS